MAELMSRADPSSDQPEQPDAEQPNPELEPGHKYHSQARLASYKQALIPDPEKCPEAASSYFLGNGC